jgi:hypothetical protein
MAEEFSTEYDPQGLGTEPEARTPRGEAHAAAKAYSGGSRDTQDPFPYDPTNELLDGDGDPSDDLLAARGLRMSDSGRALIAEGDSSGFELIPPPNSNLEGHKAVEKHLVAQDEAGGVDPEVGREARRGVLRKTAEARRSAKTKGSGGDKQAAKATPPANRSATPPKSTTAKP